LKETDRLNWDHVFPYAWYPDSTPKDIYKWQIPSCIPCNNEYGVLEKDLMIRFGLCLEPDDEACKGIVEKALRSIDPDQAKNEKDRKARLGKRRQIIRQTMEGDAIPDEAIYPNFESRYAIPDSERVAVTISKKSVDRLAEKIVRGILYLENGVFVDESYEINIFTLTDSGAASIVETVRRFGEEHSKGPGIVVLRAIVPDDNISSVFVITIWGRFKTYLVVLNKDM
jgi:hypothetical protein